jgi:hypothetical protein
MRHIIPYQSVPECLRVLPVAAKSQIEGSLSSDLVSDDEELVSFWVEECGIAEEAAREAVRLRSKFRMHPICVMFPEIYE